MKRKYRVVKHKPRSLGYYDSQGKYHGGYKVTGSRRYKPIITMDYDHALRIANARNKLRKIVKKFNRR